MTLRRRIALLAVLWLGAYAPAAMASPDADWASGKSAFASGDIASALVFFESARDQGIEGPAVHYNIAVCQYELGDYAAARDTFRYIALQFPAMLGLAEYNVGLTEQRLGNTVANRLRVFSIRRLLQIGFQVLRGLDRRSHPVMDQAQIAIVLWDVWLHQAQQFDHRNRFLPLLLARIVSAEVVEKPRRDGTGIGRS